MRLLVEFVTAFLGDVERKEGKSYDESKQTLRR